MSARSRRNASYEDEPTEQYETEEYATKPVFKVERKNGYQVVYMGNKTRRDSTAVVLNSELIKAENKAKERERKKKLREFSAKSVFFNGTVESESEISSVPEDYPRVRPSLTQFNARYSDFTSGRRAGLIHHLSVRMGAFDIPKADSYSDVLAANVRQANMYTSHHQEIDGYMSISLKEENMHLWRNPSIHPELIYNRNNEVDPLVATYREDVDTAQREFESHFGRAVGRDNKKKLMENRNTFSSLNDGCIIS